MEDYKMNSKQKSYEQGRSETEMLPTLAQIVTNLENQSRTMNNMSREVNDSLFDGRPDLQQTDKIEAMPQTLMERLNRVIKLNYDTALNMEELLNKVKGVE